MINRLSSNAHQSLFGDAYDMEFVQNSDNQDPSNKIYILLDNIRLS